MATRFRSGAAFLLALSVGGGGFFDPVTCFQPPLSSANNKRHHVSSFDLTTFQASSAADFATSSSSPLDSLPAPPKTKGWFRRFRDTIRHFKDPGGYILELSRELGPVFQMYQFFSPVVVVGGQENVMEFVSERELASEVVHPQLPESFSSLHTQWSSINMLPSDPEYKNARDLYKDVLLGQEALSYHAKTLEPEVERFVDDLAAMVQENPHDHDFKVALEVRRFCMQVFSKTFTGQGLSDEELQLYDDFSKGLLQLSTRSKGYLKAEHAREVLKEENWRRFELLGKDGVAADAPGKFFHSNVVNRPGYRNNPDRIRMIMVLFVWASFNQSAALATRVLTLMARDSDSPGNADAAKKNEVHQRIRTEFQQRQQQKKRGRGGLFSQSDAKFWYFGGMPYTLGVLRESFRLESPGGLMARFSKNDFELAGYRIKAGTAVALEPRICYADESIFEQADTFEPFRWVKSQDKMQNANDHSESISASKCPFQGSALSLGRGSFFPGGYGAHQCPGVALSEILGIMIAAKMSERFESWEYSGSAGFNKDGSIRFANLPIRCVPDDLGLKFKLANNNNEI